MTMKEHGTRYLELNCILFQARMSARSLRTMRFDSRANLCLSVVVGLFWLTASLALIPKAVNGKTLTPPATPAKGTFAQQQRQQRALADTYSIVQSDGRVARRLHFDGHCKLHSQGWNFGLRL
jgi:hypothetical protein